MTYSDILATLALAVSLGVAAIGAIRARRWDRPVVVVRGREWIMQTSRSPDVQRASFDIEVYNTGNQATQIIDAGWQIDRGDGENFSFKANHGGGTTESLFSSPEQDMPAPSLPFSLNRNERRAWDFSIDLDLIRDQEQMVRTRPWVRYTSRKMDETAYGTWRPSNIALNASMKAQSGEEREDSGVN